MAFNKSWDQSTKRGKAKNTALLGILKTIKYRHELGDALKKNPLFRNERAGNIYQKLEREASVETELGKKWKAIPVEPNLLHRSYPEASDHAELAEKIRTLNPDDMILGDKIWAKLRGRDRELIKEQLGMGSIKRPSRKKENTNKVSSPILATRKWGEPQTVLTPGSRTGEIQKVAYVSHALFGNEGWRAGLLRFAGEVIRLEEAHFVVFAGGIVNKDWFKREVAGLSKGYSKEYTPSITAHIEDEVARALAAHLPRFKYPDGSFKRWYIMTSRPFDGVHGDRIIRKLQVYRDDVRHYREGGERIEVRQPLGKKSIFHGVVLPKASRLPARYMSAKIERDILDVEGQTSRELPDLWVHGTSATAVFKPSGERKVPYISIPALEKLEAGDVKIAENQVGITIVEETSSGRRIHVWSFRDFIAQERLNITGIKDGATKLQRAIVEIIKREGARHIGRLADELEIPRERVQREIQFLVQDKPSTRATWPGLRFDEPSDRYDLHREWIQEMLRYPTSALDQKTLIEDSILVFGCLHAGYTTTDYEYVVRYFPEIMLEHKIRVLCGVGDFIAGLVHSMMHKGETLQMNNTDQEQFAGEILATIIFNVFKARFTDFIRTRKGKRPSRKQLDEALDFALVLFLIKKGNHDTWQGRDGNTALVEMQKTIEIILFKNIQSFLDENGIRGINLMDMVQKKIVLVPENRPVYTLPSGIKIGLIHPYMARAQTTTLRLERGLEQFVTQHGCQVLCMANFHVAVGLHRWWREHGQCVGIQTGTEVIFTPFEMNQLKTTDFGPMLLKTLSRDGRILRTTMAAFNQPILKDPIPKWTDADQLKQKLGLLRNTR